MSSGALIPPPERDPPLSILVSGASGFVGSAVVAAAESRGMRARPLVRRPAGDGFDAAGGTPADPDAGWRDVDIVIHCAGRAHVMKDTVGDPLDAFRASNVEATLNLARRAARARIARFVFISSIKVNGEQTLPGRPFRPDDTACPVDPYGLSKHEAEQALWRVAADTGLQVVVIRPVLVYGPGVKGNFLAMLRGLELRIPLPFRLVDNRRSLVGLDNLVDLILTAAEHPGAAGQTLLVSDGEDLSTPALLKRSAAALGTRARLLPVPPALLRAAAGLVGRRAAIERLCGTLQVDISRTRATLRWTPPSSIEAELTRTAARFQAGRHAPEALRG